jgi:LCP family protein required for cell wall assembly
VRRSLPLPPIPGRDLPPPGADHPTTVSPRPSRAPAGPIRRRVTRIALALVALLGLAAAYYVGLYFYVDRSIDRVDALVTDGPEVLAPRLQESAQTYLVVGTGLPGRTGVSAVSTLIAHVSADGKQGVLVTVPPTALSDTPTCRDGDGGVRPATTEPFADALLDGGPSCLVRSVQQLTGLRVDHYLALDLHRLPDMVDALGHVSVCVPDAATGAGSQLDVAAGEQQLDGEHATAFLRPGGTGSDVTGAAAAQREQLVLTSTLRTALAGGTLADPLTLTRFLSRAGNAFTVDANTTLGDVRALGAVLGDLSGDAVQRAEVPVSRVGYVPAGSDQAAVVVDATASRELFDAVIDGNRLPAATGPGTTEGGAPAGSSTGTGAADSPPDPAATDPVPAGTLVSVAPAGVTVDVLDASGAGRTTEVADGLTAGGFRIGVRGVEPAAVDRTVVRYGSAAVEQARTVAAAVPGSVLLETDEVGNAVQLVIGSDYTGLSPVAVGTPVPTDAAPTPLDEGTGAASACS